MPDWLKILLGAGLGFGLGVVADVAGHLIAAHGRQQQIMTRLAAVEEQQEKLSNDVVYRSDAENLLERVRLLEDSVTRLFELIYAQRGAPPAPGPAATGP